MVEQPFTMRPLFFDREILFLLGDKHKLKPWLWFITCVILGGWLGCDCETRARTLHQSRASEAGTGEQTFSFLLLHQNLSEEDFPSWKSIYGTKSQTRLRLNKYIGRPGSCFLDVGFVDLIPPFCLLVILH